MKNLSRFAISLRFVTDYKSSHQFLPKGPINSVDWTFDRLHSPIDDPENSEVFEGFPFFIDSRQSNVEPRRF
jgi:hypothetical protein